MCTTNATYRFNIISGKKIQYYVSSSKILFPTCNQISISYQHFPDIEKLNYILSQYIK